MQVIRAAVLTAILTLHSGPGWSASAVELNLLHESLGTGELLEIMREEGLRQSEELRDDMFPGRGGPSWPRTVSAIYDVAEMTSVFRREFDSALADADVAPLVDFFTSDLGRQIVRLELEARRAFMEPGVEDAARQAFRQLDQKDAARVDALRDFVEVNDLIEYNVMGAMNSNLAFMRGLGESDAFDMSEADILSDVWAREAEIRDDTAGWVFSYLAMAYQPLATEDIRTYFELSGTEAGQELNRALFAGFDAVFNEISYDLGRSASRFVVGEEL